jgi:uncharacterized surface protein with fasciclin (FAS1) repeats
MKTTHKMLMTLAVLTIAITPTLAVAGGCSSGHAKEASAEKTMSIYATAVEGGFNTLAAAVKAAGLEEVLSNDGPFTVFAPTDEAFAKLPEGTVEKLLADPEQLKQILLYHVASGKVASGDVVKLTSAKTLNGQKVAINAKDGVMINDATVIAADVMADNGIIHAIDTVLIPEKI